MVTQDALKTLWDVFCRELNSDEVVSFSVIGEKSTFVRFNHAKIRQMGQVEDQEITLRYYRLSSDGVRDLALSTTLRQSLEENQKNLSHLLKSFRLEVVGLPVNPFAEPPQAPSQPAGAGSQAIFRGSLLEDQQGIEAVGETLLKPVHGLDFTGIYSSGPCIRAGGHSRGSFHWYQTETFTLDYSLIDASERAVKGSIAGREWSDENYQRELERSKVNLEYLKKRPQKLERGTYRVYLAPAAMADLLHMFAWGTLGEKGIRQGESCLARVRAGEKQFSPRVTLSEDFGSGLTPRFNDRGELSPEKLNMIQQGRLVGSLVSASSAKEFACESNAATEEETPRALNLAPGDLPSDLEEDRILEKLGTGVLLSNLHYLNWSDRVAGRITGLTRFACLWVENGKRIAPIETMRWDESLFQFLGDGLEGLTSRSVLSPETSTYGHRSIGGVQTPGAIVNSMQFTL